MQFLDLYFFAHFKHLYALTIDRFLEETDKTKLTLADKRIFMARAVAEAWEKITATLKFEELFRKLGYINPGPQVKLDVLPQYTFDPLLGLPRTVLFGVVQKGFGDGCNDK